MTLPMANFHEQRSVKVGHFYVTSKQSENIINNGAISINDFVKKATWKFNHLGFLVASSKMMLDNKGTGRMTAEVWILAEHLR